MNATRIGGPAYAFDQVPPAPRPFGIVAPARLLAWHKAVLDWLALVPGAELELVVETEEPSLPVGRPRGRALRTIDDRAHLARAPTLSAAAAAGPARNLEFVLVLGDAEPADVLHLKPRLGVWCFSAGLEAVALRAIVERREVAEVALLGRTNGNERSILRRGAFRVTPASMRGTIDRIMFGAAAFPALALRDAALGAGDLPTEEAAPSTEEAAPLARTEARALQARRLAVTAAALGRLFVQVAVKRARWNVGIFDGSMTDFLSAPHPRPIRWLPPPPRHLFRADPFPYPGEGVILLEEWDDRAGRGRIAAIDTSGAPVHMAGIEARGVHQSYPYLFLADERVHCVPETAEARRAALYAATSPGRWEHVGELLSGVAAIDTTVFHHDGLWWLACTDRDVDHRSQLFLWHADSLRGPWRPHRRNPVVIDPRSSRPAGTPVMVGGALYRPAQDCALTYGRRVIVKRVLRLTPDEYAEETATVVEPDPDGPYPHGLHTLASDGEVTVIDGRRMAFDPRAGWHYLRNMMRARRFGF